MVQQGGQEVRVLLLSLLQGVFYEVLPQELVMALQVLCVCACVSACVCVHMCQCMCVGIVNACA